jgi:hypothetical protein
MVRSTKNREHVDKEQKKNADSVIVAEVEPTSAARVE